MKSQNQSRLRKGNRDMNSENKLEFDPKAEREWRTESFERRTKLLFVLVCVAGAILMSALIFQFVNG